MADGVAAVTFLGDTWNGVWPNDPVDGVSGVVASLMGWSDGASSTGSATQRAYRDGAWLDDAFYEARTIVLGLTLWADTQDQLASKIDQIKARLPVRDLAPLSVLWGSSQTFAMVRVDGKPSFVFDSPTTVTVSIQLVAPNPRIFVGDGSAEFTRQVSTGLPSSVGGLKAPLKGPFKIGASVVSGQVTITSEGATPRCQLVITGPVQTPRVIDSTANRTMTFNLNLDTGQSLVIDLDKRTVMLNGQASVRNKMSGRWIEPTNGTVLKFDAANNNTSAQLTALWTPARR